MITEKKERLAQILIDNREQFDSVITTFEHWTEDLKENIGYYSRKGDPDGAHWAENELKNITPFYEALCALYEETKPETENQ